MSYKQRQNAMKRYFTYIDREQDCLKKPWIAAFQGEEYFIFTNSHSAALMKEKCNDLDYLTDCTRFPEIQKLVDYSGIKKKVNLSKIFVKAKEQGYKLSKWELSPKFNFLLYYDRSYYKLGLVHAAYAIIDDGNLSIVYHQGENISPLVISNDIGMCIIMPMKYPSEQYIRENGYIVINLIDE